PEEGRGALAGRDAWMGFDLAARQDLCSWCLAFPDEDDGADFLWRFWIPEDAAGRLDKRLNGQLGRWASAGWLTITDGAVLDFQRVYADIEADAEAFNILGGDADQWSSDPVIQEISRRTGIEEIYSYANTFQHMTP